MPCFRPVEVTLKRLAKYGVMKYESAGQQVVPCGNCSGCKAEQGRQWGVRMMHEARMHESSHFVTLTYRKEDLPENGSLCPKDLSGFIKRLRKTQEKPISFFGCGEYGERTQRAHYHALLFGTEFLDRSSSFDIGRPDVWKSQTLEDTWGMGNTEGGTVTMASACYVAGYIRKKMRYKDFARANPETGELLEQEFSRMSLRPAIGQRWLQRHWRDVYPRDYVVVDGIEAKPPRYYDKWMTQEHEWWRCWEGCKKHQNIMEEVRNQRYLDAVDMTPYQMNAAEKALQSRIELFQRRDTI